MPRRVRDWRHGHPESGHAGRQHRQRVAGGRFSTRAAVYDAELELVSASGHGGCPMRGFHIGYKQMDLRPEELIGTSACRGREEPAANILS